MDNEHTPGPWRWLGHNVLVGGDRETILQASDDGKSFGMHLGVIEHHWDDRVAACNARLIAMAPELFDALDGVMTVLDNANIAPNAEIERAVSVITRVRSANDSAF